MQFLMDEKKKSLKSCNTDKQCVPLSSNEIIPEQNTNLIGFSYKDCIDLREIFRQLCISGDLF